MVLLHKTRFTIDESSAANWPWSFFVDATASETRPIHFGGSRADAAYRSFGLRALAPTLMTV
jgi:hypothetical protein